jgi:hypothetical protein
VANTLWRCLMKDGLWHRVLKDKYLNTSSVVAWLRCSPVKPHDSSITWHSLLNSLHVVTHWMAWKWGSGISIRLGEDVILGLGNQSFLSTGLIASLRQRGIHFLYQAKGSGRPGAVLDHWKSNSDLGLVGVEAAEWVRLCRELVSAGITLTDCSDTLIWTGGDNSGNISAKNAYDALASKTWLRSTCWWHNSLWNWDIAPKLKLFTWLLLENKILTWEILQQRGWSGPSVCVLCLQESETTLHLPVHCSFT